MVLVSVDGMTATTIPELEIETHERFRRLGDAIAKEPALLTSAVRATILAVVAFGVKWSPEAIGATMLAVEAWLALVTRAFSVPARQVQTQVATAVAVERANITDFLAAQRPLRVRPATT